MGSFSIWHWLIVILLLVVPSALFARVIARAGYSGWWALLGLVPVVNVIALWIFAFAQWPGAPRVGGSSNAV